MKKIIYILLLILLISCKKIENENEKTNFINESEEISYENNKIKDNEYLNDIIFDPISLLPEGNQEWITEYDWYMQTSNINENPIVKFKKIEIPA